MGIHDNAALFACVRGLVDTIQAAGDGELAQELEDALAVGSLPREILGAVRSTLYRVRQHALYRRLDVRRRVNDAIVYIDRVLGP